LKIALDSWVLASRLRQQGTYVYAQNLISQFKQIATRDPEINFCLFASPQAANDANQITAGLGFELSMTDLLARESLWRLGGARMVAKKNRADLIFCPTASILPSGGIPVVCTIHDVTPVTMPSHSRRMTLMLRSLFWWIARFSRAIITDSECSRKDLIEIYGLPESKVSVVHLAYDKAAFNSEAPSSQEHRALLSRLDVKKPYILHHGAVQPRKNLKRLIAAYRLLLSRNKNLDFELVLAGNLGWEYEEIVTAAAEPGAGRVILCGPVSDKELPLLIKGAEIAVIPSLYEGFCLPMVECMACGIPTIAANASCLPEISDGRLLYFDPLSIEEMADCMQRVIESKVVKQDLIAAGLERARDFDWGKCARETLSVLKKHAAKGDN